MKPAKFPIIDGKKRCIRCEVEKPTNQFLQKKSGAWFSNCRECERIRQRPRYSNPDYVVKRRVYNAARYENLEIRAHQKTVGTAYHKKFAQELRDKANAKNIESKRRAIKYMGGKCMCCGYDKCEAALDFHHVNPSEKEHRVAVIMRLSWEFAKKEIDKCVLVCSRCHREIHAGFTESPKLPVRIEIIPVLDIED